MELENLEGRCADAVKRINTQSLYYCERIGHCVNQIVFNIGEYSTYCRKESWENVKQNEKNDL